MSSTNPETVRKRNSQEKETAAQRNKRLKRDRERQQQKRAGQSGGAREEHLASDRNRKKRRREAETTEERNTRQAQDRGRRRAIRNSRRTGQEIPGQMEIDADNSDTDEPTTHARPAATEISEDELRSIQNFRARMDNIQYKLCPICQERIPSMVLVNGMCRRCNKEKGTKKFSKDNDMDPGEVLEELQGLTEIEEMLIAQVFTVISVYRLRGGQHGYRGNVINFPQDVQEFTTSLPRQPSTLNVLVVRRQSANDPTAFRDFRVRRDKVARALLWLKENNDYYKDINIDNKILNSLPEDDSIIDMLPRLRDDQITDKNTDIENGDDGISRSFVPLLPATQREEVVINDTLERLQNQSQYITWPEIDGNPINEFQTIGYIVRAFPTLYPTGIADLRASREKKIKPAEYFKHLMWYKDGRFARHPRWRYFALNSIMRWRALQEGRIYVKQNLEDDQLEVADIQEMIASGDKKLADRIMRYGEGLRGTRQFWMARRCELSDMIKQIGHQGMIFFTFSAADLHWPELHKLMPDDGTTYDETESAKQRQRNIIENPHLATWFFNKRFETFLENVLIPRWELEDWWYRYEWQHRGSVHVHGIGRKRNAPIIDWRQIKENEIMMNNAIQYIDSVVTTINPGINAAIPERHPCQKRSDEIDYDSKDYIELINKLQRHTRCSPSYCIRVNRSKEQICRFGYPKECYDHTFIREDNHEQPELVTKRNDPYINPHNRMQLQGWRANVDLKPVISIHAALQYISKYASKAEPRSIAFTEMFNQILNNSKQDGSSLTSIQKLLLNSVAERDISAQETSHLLLSIPLYHSSRSFVSLNLNEQAPRWVCGTGNSDETSDDVGQTAPSPLNRYWNRPDSFEDFSLFKLHLTHKWSKGKWKRCEKENIVRIYPRPSALRDGDQWEEFCRVKVILHIPHRSIQQLKGNSFTSWSTLYSQYNDMINADPTDLLGSPVDNEEDNGDEESLEELSGDDELEEYRHDWMHLAEMGPNVRINTLNDLGTRDMDRNHDWIHEGRQYYSDDDIAKAGNFINNESGQDWNRGDKSVDRDLVDVQTLNEKQKSIFNRIDSHYNDILMGKEVEPLGMIVMGTAGTRKSYLIRAIRERLRTMARSGSKPPVIVIAPTGVAAFNINGATIHSMLSIPIINAKRDKGLDIDGERLKQLQERLQDVQYVIIDEKSMVGRRMLAQIDKRLRQAFPEHKNEPFGGRSIILFGDFGQLPPVLDLPMYVTEVSQDPVSNDGIAAYKHFSEAYKLDVVQRQSGESEEQRAFRDILLRLRDGESVLDDWRMLSTRFEENLSRTERDRFSDAIHLLTTWDEVDRVNTDMLRSLNCPIAKILAEHTGGSEARKATSDVAKGLEAQLLLAKGARVMLTANVWTQVGLVNGAMGTIQDIIFGNEGPPSLPIAVFISFDKYEGPTISNSEGVKVVPIVPIKRAWEGKNGTHCSRLQIPICLAWAVTVHKSQGLTLAKSKIDLGNREFAAGLSFVAVSRVRSLSDLYFKGFNFDRLEHNKNSRRLQERKLEEERLLFL